MWTKRVWVMATKIVVAIDCQPRNLVNDILLSSHFRRQIQTVTSGSVDEHGTAPCTHTPTRIKKFVDLTQTKVCHRCNFFLTKACPKHLCTDVPTNKWPMNSCLLPCFWYVDTAWEVLESKTSSKDVLRRVEH